MNEWCFDLNAYDKEKAFEEISICFNKIFPYNRLLNEILDCVNNLGSITSVSKWLFESLLFSEYL